MNSDSYKKGYSALRKIINDDELEFSRQFAKFTFCMGERWSSRSELKGIYNSKTKNVIAFVNKKGNVFFRPSSIYADHILESKNKVLFHNDLRSLRNKVPSNIKSNAVWHNMAEMAVDRLIKNDDEPNKVFIFSFSANSRIDERFIMKEIKFILKKSPFKNTIYSLENGSLEAEQIINQDKYKVYLKVDDNTEAIAQKERVDRIKSEIAETFIGHIREISQNSITAGHTMNPMQFTFTESNGTEVTGSIALNRLDMSYPSDMPVRDWLQPEYVTRYITFSERLGSLQERGIDEQAIRAERESVEVERRSANEAQAQMYEHMANINTNNLTARGLIDYSQYARGRVSSSDWGMMEETAMSPNPFGTGVVMHYAVDPSVEVPDLEPGAVWNISRDMVQPVVMPEMPMPRMSIYEDEYPDTPDEADDILRELLADTDTTTETDLPMSSA